MSNKKKRATIKDQSPISLAHPMPKSKPPPKINHDNHGYDQQKALEEAADLLLSQPDTKETNSEPSALMDEVTKKTRHDLNFEDRSPEQSSGRRVDYVEVIRPHTVKVVGDLHGNLQALYGNLLALGFTVGKKGQVEWTIGEGKLVFLGDVLADRYGQGLAIMKLTRQLKEKAHQAGGHVIQLIGNHDDWFISYLMSKKVPFDNDEGSGLKYDDPVSVSLINRHQGLGLTELIQHYSGLCDNEEPEDLIPDLHRFYLHLPDYLYGQLRKKIWAALERDGQDLLAQLKNLHLLYQIDDTLLTHCTPTDAMLKLVLTYGVDQLNQIYQTALKESLEAHENRFTGEAKLISETFLNTDNRLHKLCRDQHIIDKIRDQGINLIMHGHDYQTDPIEVNLDHGQFMIVGIDRNFGHRQKDEPSIAKISFSGRLDIAGKLVRKGKE